MIIVQKETTPIADECILLGRQCENEARQIQFDLSWLIGEYGSGTATLVHQRNKDTAPYICTATQTGNTLTWTLDNQDTAYDGWGKAELRWTVGDVLAKTLIYKTMVIRSITADTTIPEPLESWYDQMIEYIDEHGIDPEDLAAAIAAYLEEHPVEAPVQSVNNKTGAVVLSASDVGAGTYSKPSGGIPKTDLASGVQSSLDKADSALQSYTETDPTVPSWAKQQNKPTYTAQEVGALPSDTTIPTKVSQLQNDSGFGTYSKPSGGIPKTDLASAVQTSLGKADSALQTAPVSSVDGKTGSVTVLPSGGTEGQVLKKSSGADYAVEWDDSTGGIDATGDGTVTIVEAGGEIGVNSVNGKTGVVTLTATDVGALPNSYTPPVSSVNGQTGAVSLSIPSASSATPQALGTAAAGSSSDYSRADHVHAKPTASDIGAIAAPVSPSSGQYLIWNGSAWVAASLPVYSGGVS